MKQQILVIIDVQEGYSHSITPLFIEKVKSLILEWQERKHPILIVKFRGDGDLYEDLHKLVEYYQHIFWCEKSQEDGSSEIAQVIDDNELTDEVVMCGMYEDVCVAETIEGMLDNQGWDYVTVVRDALISSGYESGMQGLFKKNKVRFVNANDICRHGSRSSNEEVEVYRVGEGKDSADSRRFISVRAGYQAR